MENVKHTPGDMPLLDQKAEQLADAVLRAAGSRLGNYTMPSVRAAIIIAALDGYTDAFKNGVDYAIERVKAAGLESPTKARGEQP